MNEDRREETQQNIRWTKLRRKGLKVLAFCERVRVSFARHPVSPLMYVVVLALILGVITFNRTYTQAYVLTVDGKEVGVIADEGDVDTIVSDLECWVSGILGEDYEYAGEVELTPTLAGSGNLSDLSQMEEQLFANTGALVEAYALSVDGVEMGYAPSEEVMQNLLDRIAAPYITENTTGYDFVEDVQVYPVSLPSNTKYCLDELYEALTVCTVEEAYYTVVKGDTFNKIAYALDMTPAELSDLNPDVEVGKIYIGQQLIIQRAVPFLSVRTFANETYEAVVESPIEYIETPDLYVGNTKVKEQGTDGKALVNADATYINGIEVERVVITSETLEEPTITYVYTGTTPRPKTASNGYYIWPVSGRVTSEYGYRYLQGKYDFHLGIDIGASRGVAIKAADGGTVTYAGWRGTYGKLVIITHDDGSQTYYAHCSTIVVSKGDKVYQGQTIAKVGSTGNSTGPHLHFEIRINGKTVNPRKYLK